MKSICIYIGKLSSEVVVPRTVTELENVKKCTEVDISHLTVSPFCTGRTRLLINDFIAELEQTDVETERKVYYNYNRLFDITPVQEKKYDVEKGVVFSNFPSVFNKSLIIDTFGREFLELFDRIAFVTPHETTVWVMPSWLSNKTNHDVPLHECIGCAHDVRSLLTVSTLKVANVSKDGKLYIHYCFIDKAQRRFHLYYPLRMMLTEESGLKSLGSVMSPFNCPFSDVPWAVWSQILPLGTGTKIKGK